MQKFINKLSELSDESIEGFVKLHQDKVAFTNSKRAICLRSAPIQGKVGIVCGGGYGHDPAFLGYLGEGMVDAVAIGNIFSPPDPQAFEMAIRVADSGKGIVCLVGNFIQDIKSLNLAVQALKKENIEVQIVVINDDVAKEETKTRRGNTGEVLIWKVVGAAAQRGDNIDDIVKLAKIAVKRIKTIGVGLSSCVIPDVGCPNYIIDSGTMEIGVGHHGMPSMKTVKLRTANETATMMLDKVMPELELTAGERVCVMINGLGNTLECELNLLYRKVFDSLNEKGIIISKSFVGEYFTSLDMMGATLTIMKLNNELECLLKYPAYPVAFDNYRF